MDSWNVPDMSKETHPLIIGFASVNLLNRLVPNFQGSCGQNGYFIDTSGLNLLWQQLITCTKRLFLTTSLRHLQLLRYFLPMQDRLFLYSQCVQFQKLRITEVILVTYTKLRRLGWIVTTQVKIIKLYSMTQIISVDACYQVGRVLRE